MRRADGIEGCHTAAVDDRATCDRAAQAVKAARAKHAVAADVQGLQAVVEGASDVDQATCAREAAQGGCGDAAAQVQRARRDIEIAAVGAVGAREVEDSAIGLDQTTGAVNPGGAARIGQGQRARAGTQGAVVGERGTGAVELDGGSAAGRIGKDAVVDDGGGVVVLHTPHTVLRQAGGKGQGLARHAIAGVVVATGAGQRGGAATGHRQALRPGTVPVPDAAVFGHRATVGQGDTAAADIDCAIDSEVGEAAVAQGYVGQVRRADGIEGEPCTSNDGATQDRAAVEGATRKKCGIQNIPGVVQGARQGESSARLVHCGQAGCRVGVGQVQRTA